MRRYKRAIRRAMLAAGLAAAPLALIGNAAVPAAHATPPPPTACESMNQGQQNMQLSDLTEGGVLDVNDGLTNDPVWIVTSWSPDSVAKWELCWTNQGSDTQGNYGVVKVLNNYSGGFATEAGLANGDGIYSSLTQTQWNYQCFNNVSGMEYEFELHRDSGSTKYFWQTSASTLPTAELLNSVFGDVLENDDATGFCS